MIRNSERFLEKSFNPHSKIVKTLPHVSFLPNAARWMSNDKQKCDDTEKHSSSSIDKILSLCFLDAIVHLRSLKETSKQNFKLDAQTIRSYLLRTRHSNLELDKCRVDISTLPDAGFGVFTTKAIRKDEVITLYPGDAIEERTADGEVRLAFGIHIEEPELIKIVAALNKQYDQPYDERNYDSGSQHFMMDIDKARRYVLEVNDTFSLIGDPDRKADPAYLGHMINDSCKEISRNDNDEPIEMGRQYDVQSIQNMNCAIEVGIEQWHVKIVATRDITSGEELFLSYGSEYWSAPCHHH